MMSSRTLRSVLAGAVMAAVLMLGACGDDDDSGADADDTEMPAPAPDGDAPVGTGDGDLGPIAFGLRVSLQADRVEVDGNTIHIYVKESDNIVAGAGSECIVASQAVPEGTTVIIHRDGGETTC